MEMERGILQKGKIARWFCKGGKKGGNFTRGENANIDTLAINVSIQINPDCLRLIYHTV